MSERSFIQNKMANVIDLTKVSIPPSVALVSSVNTLVFWLPRGWIFVYEDGRIRLVYDFAHMDLFQQTFIREKQYYDITNCTTRYRAFQEASDACAYTRGSRPIDNKPRGTSMIFLQHSFGWDNGITNSPQDTLKALFASTNGPVYTPHRIQPWWDVTDYQFHMNVDINLPKHYLQQ
jgi:hypothetical protein